MHSAFAYVIWIVCGVGVIVAIVTLIGSGKVWEEIGRRGLVMDREEGSRSGSRSGARSSSGARMSAAALAERDSEIRQMLEARNLRRERRGEPPLDIEAELRRLTAPAVEPRGTEVDEGLREEIRQLVEARNHRRARRGEPPLDVETEVRRQIDELTSP